MVGLNKFDIKDRRRQRRNYERNHIAYDLKSPKYHQRIIEKKKNGRNYEDDYEDVDASW